MTRAVSPTGPAAATSDVAGARTRGKGEVPMIAYRPISASGSIRTAICTVFAATLLVAAPLSAQTSVSTADIQRLQDEVYQASSDVSRLRTTDALQAGRLQDELDGVREEVIYLKVKLRKEGNINRSEYTEVRDKLQDLRSRSRGEGSRASSGSGSGSGTGSGTYQAGTSTSKGSSTGSGTG